VHSVTVSNGQVPSKPRDPAATAGDHSAEVTWSKPSSEGDNPITGYLVTSSPDDKTCSTTVPDRT
jgi:hypothetical protein